MTSITSTCIAPTIKFVGKWEIVGDFSCKCIIALASIDGRKAPANRPAIIIIAIIEYEAGLIYGHTKQIYVLVLFSISYHIPITQTLCLNSKNLSACLPQTDENQRRK